MVQILLMQREPIQKFPLPNWFSLIAGLETFTKEEHKLNHHNYDNESIEGYI